TDPHEWRPELYRALLRLQAQQMRLDPRLRRRQDASDIAHEAIVKAFKKRSQLRGRTEGEFVRWLQQILAHEAIITVRRERAEKRDVALEQSLHATAAESSLRWEAVLADRNGSPAEEAEWRELLLRLVAAIDQLPDGQHEVVVCRDLMGMAVADIAGQ